MNTMSDPEKKTVDISTLRGILGDISDGIILVDVNENILYMNDAAEDLLEFELQDGVEAKFSEVCRLVNLDTMEEFFSPIRRTLRVKKSVGLGKNIGFVRSDGPVYLSATCSLMRDDDGGIIGCSVILRNITRLRLLEKKVESDHHYMRSVFEAAKVGMCTVNMRGEIVDINETALETMGCDYHNAVGIQIGDAIKCVNCVEMGCGRGSECRYCVVRNNLEAAMLQEHFNSDFVVAMETLRHAEPQWLHIFMSQMWRGKEKQIVMSIVDISRRKKWENELVAAQKAAENASNTKTQFLANMSHEIRTPINGMCGMINLTLKTDLTDDQRENLNNAKQCSDDLLRIINDILDYSKLENGKMQIENIDLDLHEQLDRVCSLHGQVAEGKGLYMRRPDVDELPRFVRGDPLRLRQILHNLLANAVKFTTHGGITVECRVLEHGKRMLEFTVTDTGIGMSDKDQNKLFKPFSQVDGSTTRRFGGTGLGLMIVKELVTAMGGDITVTSKLDQGSSFIFWIPLVLAEKADKEMKDRTVYMNPYKTLELHEVSLSENTIERNTGIAVSEPDNDILDLLKYCNDKLGET